MLNACRLHEDKKRRKIRCAVPRAFRGTDLVDVPSQTRMILSAEKFQEFLDEWTERPAADVFLNGVDRLAERFGGVILQAFSKAGPDTFGQRGSVSSPSKPACIASRFVKHRIE